MTKNRYYPQALVSLQFSLIGFIVFFSQGFLSNILAIILFITGLLIGLWALNHNQLGNFNIQPKLKEGSSLITTGIYKYIRHPMYLSVLTTMFSFVLSTANLLEILLFISLLLVLLLKAKREESLWLEHDEKYKRYKERTKLFLPFVL
jgi:protein-S-isoprenylcysteine O-methyltransferase Ste14